MKPAAEELGQKPHMKNLIRKVPVPFPWQT